VKAFVLPILSLAACGSAEAGNDDANSAIPNSRPTVRELKDQNLILLERVKAIGATGPAKTGVVDVLVFGPVGTEKVFDPERQYMCQAVAGLPEDDLTCFPRASVIRAEPTETRN
jgi:hypothetical protein